LFALPPWPETYRVVATYGTLLNLDVQPLLRRIYAQVEAGIVELAPKSMPDVPFMAPPDGLDRQPQGQPASRPPAERQPRQAAPAQPRGPQGAPGRPGAGPRQAQAPQMRPGAPPRPQGAQPQMLPQRMPGGQQRPLPPQQPQGAPPAPQRPRPPAPTQGRPVPQPAAGAAQPPRAAPLPEPKPARKALPWKPVLKWAAVVLVVLGGTFALWKWLAEPALLGTGSAPKSGASAPSAPDPNDPRSRKADRLPGAS
jgi:hypothetical protein